MKNKGEVEILLLLCCLVGMVAFVCFAFGAINLSTMERGRKSSDIAELNAELDSLTERVQRGNSRKVEAREVTEKLSEIVRENEKRISSIGYFDDEFYLKQRELSRLLSDSLELETKRRQKERELAAVPAKGNEVEQRIGKEELSRLRNQREVINRDISEERDKLEKLQHQPPKADSLELIMNKMREEIAKLKIKKPTIKRKGTFNPFTDLPGSESLKNPLFVECKKEFVVTYPGNNKIDISNLDSGDPFQVSAKGHDAIIFLVRPDGYESFGKCISLAEKKGTKTGYEPIDEDWVIDFSREGK